MGYAWIGPPPNPRRVRSQEPSREQHTASEIGQRVHDGAAVSQRAREPGVRQRTQMLAHRRGGDAERVGEFRRRGRCRDRCGHSCSPGADQPLHRGRRRIRALGLPQRAESPHSVGDGGLERRVRHDVHVRPGERRRSQQNSVLGRCGTEAGLARSEDVECRPGPDDAGVDSVEHGALPSVCGVDRVAGDVRACQPPERLPMRRDRAVPELGDDIRDLPARTGMILHQRLDPPAPALVRSVEPSEIPIQQLVRQRTQMSRCFGDIRLLAPWHGAEDVGHEVVTGGQRDHAVQRRRVDPSPGLLGPASEERSGVGAAQHQGGESDLPQRRHREPHP